MTLAGGCGQTAGVESSSASSPSPETSLPSHVEVRSVASVVAYHESGETSVIPAAAEAQRVALSGDRVLVPVHVGHQNSRAVFQDVPFVLRRVSDGLSVTPAAGTVVAGEAHVADQVREALANPGAVRVAAGEWTTILDIGGGDTAWQMRWDEAGGEGAAPAP